VTSKDGQTGKLEVRTLRALADIIRALAADHADTPLAQRMLNFADELEEMGGKTEA
jgi:hypothetical protein